MNCQKCRSKMEKSYLRNSKCTVELWTCSNNNCDYSFEIRTTSRGLNYCFEQEQDLTYQRGGQSSEIPTVF